MSNVIDPLAGTLRNQRYREYTRQRQYSTGDILLDNRIIFFGSFGKQCRPVLSCEPEPNTSPLF